MPAVDIPMNHKELLCRTFFFLKKVKSFVLTFACVCTPV